MSLKPVLAVVTAAAVIAGGAFAVSVADLLAPAEDDALELVPADAAIYMNVFLDPSVPQKLALDDLLARFPEAGDRDGARDRIVELLDQGLAEVGLTFDADIEPWLGDQIAFFMQAPVNFTSEPGVAMLFEAEDIDAALAAVDKAQAADSSHTFTPRRYVGVDYEVDPSGIAIGAVDSFLVSGTETGLKAAIDASRGPSLAGADRFEAALVGLAEDRLALAYLDPAAFARLAVGFPGAPGFGGAGTGGAFNPLNQGAAAFVAYARGDGLVIEGSSRLPQDPALAAAIRSAARESKMLERLPGDAWLAFGAPDLGRSIGALLKTFESAFAKPQGGAFPGMPPGGLLAGFEAALGLDLERDLLAWMGDAGFFVSGTQPADLGGGIVVTTSDPEASRDALDKIRAFARGAGVPIKRSRFEPPDRHGFAIQTNEMPDAVNVLVDGSELIVAYGAPATGGVVADTSGRLSSSDIFGDARASLGDGYALGGFVDLSAVFDLVERSGVLEGPYRHELQSWFQPLSFISFGTKIEGDSTLQRVVLGVR